MKLNDEIEKIRRHFQEISDEELIEKLEYYGLGRITDPDRQGFYRLENTNFDYKSFDSVPSYSVKENDYYEVNDEIAIINKMALYDFELYNLDEAA